MSNAPHGHLRGNADRLFGPTYRTCPGCVAAGKTRSEVGRLIRSAKRSHAAMMRSMGERVPAPSTWSDTVVAQDA